MHDEPVVKIRITFDARQMFDKIAFPGRGSDVAEGSGKWASLRNS